MIPGRPGLVRISGAGLFIYICSFMFGCMECLWCRLGIPLGGFFLIKFKNVFGGYNYLSLSLINEARICIKGS